MNLTQTSIQHSLPSSANTNVQNYPHPFHAMVNRLIISHILSPFISCTKSFKTQSLFQVPPTLNPYSRKESSFCLYSVFMVFSTNDDFPKTASPGWPL